MEEFSFEVLYCHLGISTFKETEINRLKLCILGKIDVARIIKFKGYGIINFENSRGDKWHVTVNEKFTRGKIHCLVFDVIEDEINNPYNYSKLIVFQNLTKSIDSYGYVWVKDNGTSLLRFCLEHLDDEVANHMMQDLNGWKLHHIYAAYNNESKLSGLEMEKEYKKYIETYRAISYKDWQDGLKTYNQRYKVG